MFTRVQLYHQWHQIIIEDEKEQKAAYWSMSFSEYMFLLDRIGIMHEGATRKHEPVQLSLF